MTFATKLKNEICSDDPNIIIKLSELSAIIRYGATIHNNSICMTFENAFVARKVYKDIKTVFNISAHIIVRNQKRLRAKQIYILEINHGLPLLEKLNIKKENKFLQMNRDYLVDEEEIMAYVRATFLVTGSINDPAKGGYHLEFVFMNKKDAVFLDHLLHEMKFDSKMIKRNNRMMVYIKNSEEISDMLKVFHAPNSLFYFEDIRIYRDHKNMVNRLNNCEIANQEKSTRAGLEFLKIIKTLKEKDLLDLLDENTKLVLEYREKYPESSYQELAYIISTETDYHIGKSGINHHLIKAKKLITNYEQSKKI